MNKLEQAMLKAVNNRENWESGNTSVLAGIKDTDVFLHGNHIATVTPDGQVGATRQTLREWPTATTISRLRALGVKVHKHKHQVYIDGYPA